jgi:drug/metabolite transporter superfamily protein YnfA
MTKYRNLIVALLGSLTFKGIVPDMFDVIGATMACVLVAIIYCALRREEEKLWSN